VKNDEPPTGPDEPIVVDNVTAGRFELEIDGHLSLLVYRRTHGRLVLRHTEVPPELQGHGIAGRLVQAAIDDAVHDDLVVVPLCPYARDWIERHPESAALVEVQWPAD
jgi:predicted GNAT family acetyltransferase